MEAAAYIRSVTETKNVSKVSACLKAVPLEAPEKKKERKYRPITPIPVEDIVSNSEGWYGLSEQESQRSLHLESARRKEKQL